MSAARVLVIGGNGFLGGALVREFLDRGIETRGTFRNSATALTSLRFAIESDSLLDVLQDFQPGTIVFAAHVEDKLDDARLLRGVEKLIVAAAKFRFVYVSSDALFDGTRGNYAETDPVSPITPYGRGLMLAEKMVREHCANFLIVRPSYLFGASNGSLDKRLSSAVQQAEEKQLSPYFIDMFRSPMEVTFAAEVIADLALGSLGSIVHVGGPRCSVFSFYEQGLRALGHATEHLVPVAMPPSSGFARDTSLDISRMIALTGKTPQTVFDALIESAGT